MGCNGNMMIKNIMTNFYIPNNQICAKTAGGCLNIKMSSSSCQYRDIHVKDKTVVNTHVKDETV